MCILKKKKPSRSRKEAGFSLVEALAALAIISVIIIGLFNGLSTAVRTTHLGYCQAKGAVIGKMYASLYKAGVPVSKTIKKGPWTVKFALKKTSDNKTVSVFEIYLGGKKCIDVPAKQEE